MIAYPLFFQHISGSLVLLWVPALAVSGTAIRPIFHTLCSPNPCAHLDALLGYPHCRISGQTPVGLILDTAQARVILPQTWTLQSRSLPTLPCCMIVPELKIALYVAVLFVHFHFRHLQLNILSSLDKSVQSLDRMIHLALKTELSLTLWLRKQAVELGEVLLVI